MSDAHDSPFSFSIFCFQKLKGRSSDLLKARNFLLLIMEFSFIFSWEGLLLLIIHNNSLGVFYKQNIL